MYAVELNRLCLRAPSTTEIMLSLPSRLISMIRDLNHPPHRILSLLYVLGGMAVINQGSKDRIYTTN